MLWQERTDGAEPPSRGRLIYYVYKTQCCMHTVTGNDCTSEEAIHHAREGERQTQAAYARLALKALQGLVAPVLRHLGRCRDPAH